MAENIYAKNIGKILLLTLIFIFILAVSIEAATAYYIPLHGDVEPGLVTFLDRSLAEAKEANAEVVIIEVDTFGGLVDSGIELRDSLVEYTGRTVVFVNNRAWSAGALIALGGDEIYMVEGSSIGAAETRPFEEKYISALRTEFASTAERQGRDPDIAAAMVDSSIAIEGVTEENKLLTLTAQDAVELGFSEGTFSSLEGLLEHLGYTSAELTRAELTPLDQIARVITNPYISIFLLTIGIVGLVGEALIPGFGVSGTIGVLSMAAFFSAYIYQGYAGLGLVVLFLAGLLLLAIEIFVIPGFGFTGIGGLTAIFLSFFLVFPESSTAWRMLAAVTVLSVVGVGVLIKLFGSTYFWRRISLGESQTKDIGYVASKDSKDLVGTTGMTVTPLRPSGIAEIKGERVDVVTQGDFIDKEIPIKVVDVKGSRIVVAKQKEE